MKDVWVQIPSSAPYSIVSEYALRAYSGKDIEDVRIEEENVILYVDFFNDFLVFIQFKAFLYIL
ncbi:MAG: hypothetical protein Q4P31_02150 [Andreesenia angusta]|nr:hypothetical protein [Andreesenia angusta]